MRSGTTGKARRSQRARWPLRLSRASSDVLWSRRCWAWQSCPVSFGARERRIVLRQATWRRSDPRPRLDVWRRKSTGCEMSAGRRVGRLGLAPTRSRWCYPGRRFADIDRRYICLGERMWIPDAKVRVEGPGSWKHRSRSSTTLLWHVVHRACRWEDGICCCRPPP